MKSFRKLCALLLLVCLFAWPAFAGDMGCPPGETSSPPGETHGTGRMGDPETPGEKGDPETPGRTAVDFQMKYALASLIESIF